MKKTIYSLIFSLASLSLAGATTTITVFNYALGADPTGFAQQVVTTSPTAPLASGTLLIGKFTTTTGLSTAPTGSLSLATLTNTYGFAQFGSTPFNTSLTQPGMFGATGVIGTLPEAGSAAGTFVGNNIFAVVANGAGNDFIVWDTGRPFAFETPGVGGAAVSAGTNTSLLVRGVVVLGGNSGLGGNLATNGRNGQNAVTFGAIPEPSAAILGALGALGLLRRRRN